MTEVLDKKANLKRVVSSETPQSTPDTAVNAGQIAVTPAVSVPDFVASKRLDTDLIPDDEGYGKAHTDRKQRERDEETKIVARMGDVEQLGLEAGRRAAAVKQLRQRLTSAQNSVIRYTKELAEAEAILDARLDALRQVGL